MPEIKLQKRLPNLSPEEERIFTEAICEAYNRGKADAQKWIPVTECENYLYGYRAEELALVAELLHRNLVSEDDLHRLFDSFSMMYKIIIEQHQLEIKNAANSVLVQSTYPSPAEVAMIMFPDVEVKEPEAKAITLRPWNDLRKESVKE